MTLLRKNRDIFEFDSGVLGPNVVILGGIHGNELCGVNAIKDFIKKIIKNNLKINIGKLTLIISNPKAIENNVRFSEENLNRCFIFDKDKTNSYEEKLSLEIKNYLDKADYVLDLHSSSNLNSEPFIICEKNCLDLTNKLDIKKICLGFTKIHPGGTDYYMNKLGKVGICVECGSLFDDSSTNVAIKTLNLFLYNLGLINLNLFNFENLKVDLEIFEVFLNYKFKNNFSLIRKFEDFEFVESGKLIGFDGSEEIKALEDGIILFAKDADFNDVNKEVFVFGRKQNL